MPNKADMWSPREILTSTWLMVKNHKLWTTWAMLIVGISLYHVVTGKPFGAKGGGNNHIDASPLWFGLLFASIGLGAFLFFWYCLHVARFNSPDVSDSK